MAKVEMYLRPTCWYCRSARRLLDEKGVDYQVIDINAAPERREEMLRRGRGTTVPQILIDDRGVLRWRKRIRYNEARWRRLLARIERLDTRRARPASRPTSPPRPAR